MKILFATSECFPFAVSGGLGDVAYALPKALRQKKVGVRVVMPLYSKIPEHFRNSMKFITSISVPVAWRSQYCGIFEATYDGVTYKSLGYTLNRNYYCKSDDLCIVNEVEFLLFDKYFIWGWIS